MASRDRCATFRWGGSLRECASALAAASSLALLADGLWYLPVDGTVLPGQAAVAAAAAELESMCASRAWRREA